MDIIRGEIQKVSADDGLDKRGKPYKRWVFVINDKKYSTFDEKIGTEFKIGQFVEIEGFQRGAYWNMQTMKICDKEAITDPIRSHDTANNGEIVNLLKEILLELKTTKI